MKIKRRLHKTDISDINYKIENLESSLSRLRKLIHNGDNLDVDEIQMQMNAILSWPYRIGESVGRAISSVGKEMD